jgi:hypothetical protein
VTRYYFSLKVAALSLWGAVSNERSAVLGCLAPNFAHVPCCMLLLSLTFSSSSEMTLCSPHGQIFTFVSLSLLCLLSEISLYYLAAVHTTPCHLCIFFVEPTKTRTQDSCPAISTFLPHSEVTRRSNVHNVQICIADCAVGNMHDV